MMGTGSPRRSPETLAPPSTDTGPDVMPAPRQATDDNDSDEQEIMFAMIKKPRVRYDVEVVTKLIVYIGTTSNCPCLPPC